MAPSSQATDIDNLPKGWETALDFLEEPICLLDLQDRVIQANKTFFASLGREPEEVIGKPVTQFFHARGEAEACPICRARKAQQDAVITLEADDPRNHLGRPIQARIGVIRDDKGKPLGIVQHIQDLTLVREAENKYLNTQKRFRNLFEASPDPQIIVNSEGIIEQANARCFAVLGYKYQELIGQSVEILLPENMRQRHADLRRMFNRSPGARPMGRGELACLRKDGTVIPAEISLTPITVDEQVSVCAVIRDVSERKEAERELHRLASFPELSPIPIIEVSSDGKITYTNPAARRTFVKFDVAGTSHPALQDLEEIIATTIESEHPVLRNIEVGGMVYEQQFSYVRENDVVRIYSWDITEIRDMASEMEYFATHDALTGLVNRSEFDRRLIQLLEQTRRDWREHALCYIDLDQFKIVNDKCGHIAGDELLRQLSQLLLKKVRDNDTLARLGGDEFGLLLQQCSLEKARQIAEDVRRAISEYRFAWDKHNFTVGASIGLVSVNSHSGALKDLLKAADTACYVAKDTGRDRIHIYNQDDVHLGRHIKNIEWAHRIQEALSDNHFLLYKQSVQALEDDNIKRYEILVRMQGEDGKLYSPGSFIPAAERFNLVESLDKWVIDEAFRLIKEGFLNTAEVSINLSGASMGDVNMVGYVINKLEQYDIAPERLFFEITETAMVTNLANAQKFMATLQGVGCRFALDDFGSGVSSFVYLQNLHVDLLKIDGGLIRGIVKNKINESMVRAINDIGHAMGIKTVAEFVEDRLVYDAIRDIGIDYAQGYYVGRPRLICPGELEIEG